MTKAELRSCSFVDCDFGVDGRVLPCRRCGRPITPVVDGNATLYKCECPTLDGTDG